MTSRDAADESRRARVRVVHPRSATVRRTQPRPPTREIDEQTELGQLYMSSLIRSQRRLAVAVCVTVISALIGAALAGAYVSELARVHVLGIELPWLVLGLLVYPLLIGLGWYALRGAERNERDFTALVRPR